MAAVTVTWNNVVGTVHTLNAAASRGQGWTNGTINASGVLYAGGGITCTMPFITIQNVQLEHRIGTSTILFYAYDITNTKIRVFQPVGPSATSGILLGGEIASDTDIGALTAIRFTAWGYS